jgi:hypothetical protein
MMRSRKSRRRCHPPASDPGEPHQQCHQVHGAGEIVIEVMPGKESGVQSPESRVQSRGRGTRNSGLGTPPWRPFLRQAQPWRLHFSVHDTGIGIPIGPAASVVQIVSTGGRLHHPPLWWHRARIGHLQETRGVDGWTNLGGQRRRPGATFHFTIETQATAPSAPPNWQSAQPQLPPSVCWSLKTTPPTGVTSSTGPNSGA